MLDPGIGFGKTVAHNLELLDRLDELTALGRPIVVGTSRKSFLGAHRLDGAGGAAAPMRPTAAGRDDRHQRARARARRERLPRARGRARARRAGGGGCYVGRAMDGEEKGTTPRS